MGLPALKQNQITLADYRQRLPSIIFCCDTFDDGVYPRPLESALAKQIIQHNPITRPQALIFDIDRDTDIHADRYNGAAALAWEDAGLPPPNITSINPANGHAHLFYLLSNPVFIGDKGSKKAANYVKAVAHGMLERLKPYGADPAYVGKLAKNPYSPQWLTRITANQPYELGYLAEFIPDFKRHLNPYHRRDHERLEREEAEALGRNATLFFDLRHWAYRAIRQGWPDRAQWLNACIDRATMFNIANNGANRLDGREVYQVAKSVAYWVHAHFTAERFSAIQAKRGRRGGKRNTSEAQAAKGKASGASRLILSQDKRAQAAELAAGGMSQREIGRLLGVHYNTVNSWLKTSQ